MKKITQMAFVAAFLSVSAMGASSSSMQKKHVEPNNTSITESVIPSKKKITVSLNERCFAIKNGEINEYSAMSWSDNVGIRKATCIGNVNIQGVSYSIMRAENIIHTGNDSSGRTSSGSWDGQKVTYAQGYDQNGSPKYFSKIIKEVVGSYIQSPINGEMEIGPGYVNRVISILKVGENLKLYTFSDK